MTCRYFNLSFIMAQMHWSCPVSSYWLFVSWDVSGIQMNQRGRQVSHFYLESSEFCPFFFALQNFKKRVWCVKTNIRIGRIKDRKRESLKGTTYGVRGSGKTLRRTFGRFSCPARFCSFCISATGIHARISIQKTYEHEGHKWASIQN